MFDRPTSQEKTNVNITAASSKQMTPQATLTHFKKSEYETNNAGGETHFYTSKIGPRKQGILYGAAPADDFA